MKFDVVIVGAGISGCTLAERYAQSGKKVLVLEKREFIGGNCYDEMNQDGLMIMKYGGHIFHTNDDNVWNYVNNFSEWIPSEHKVLSHVDGKNVPVPVNITTVNELLGLNIQTEAEMKDWLEKNTEKIKNPKNSEEIALTRVGRFLYEKMFKNYTIKQWDMEPKELDASVMARIPVRTDFNDRYFSDKYEAQPKSGYAKLMEKMLDHPNIKVELKKDFFQVKDELEYDKLFFSGKIDEFFNYKFGKLGYRSLKFEFSTYDQDHYIPGPTVNYPNFNESFTRIVEYKYFYKQKHPKTIVSREWATWEGEPFYPVPTKNNADIYGKYERLAKKMQSRGIYFIGRLANYKYINMDQAFRNALDLFAELEGKNV